MKYALMVYSDQAAWDSYTEEEAARLRAESMPAWIACFDSARRRAASSSVSESQAAWSL